MVVVRVFGRGLHHGSIFAYDVPSHRLLNELIRCVVSVFYDVVSGVESVDDVDVGRVVDVLRWFAVRGRGLGFVPVIVNRCRCCENCKFDFFLGVVKCGAVVEVFRVLFDLSLYEESARGLSVSVDYWTGIYVLEVPLSLGLFRSLVRRLTRTRVPDSPEREVVMVFVL